MSFEEFLLETASRSPFLIGESSHSHAPSPSLSVSPPPRGREDTAVLQRLLVDAPLQPLGAEHTLYHTLLPSYAAALTAARDVWKATQALQNATSTSNANNNNSNNMNGNEEGKAKEGKAGEEEEALRRALVSKQSLLDARRRQLDAAAAKVYAIVEAMAQVQRRGVEGQH